MGDKISSIGESLSTITFEFLLARVNCLVALHCRLLRERLAADATTERFLALLNRKDLGQYDFCD